ncbi:MAG: ATP-dependent helicase [Alphaproteobacteria bacterium]
MQDNNISNIPDWLINLNPEQAQAVQNTDGACLILAGAGTGKTRVITSRFVQILHTQKANPFEIMCVTFTNKAAKEMRERIESMTGSFVGNWIGTFHSLCLKILRKHCETVGLKSNFIVLADDDQLRLLKKIVPLFDLDKDRYPVKEILQKIQSYKDDALNPSMINKDDYCDGKMQMIYQAYQDRLKTLNYVDFGDIILYVVDMFKNNKDILDDYQRRFKYILVDEYQDTNIAQYQLLKLLSLNNENINIACVGDDDQSIYGWRGARVENILNFEKDFKNATVIRLEENYRSTGYILKTANSVIAQNENRLGKDLRTSLGDGEKIKISEHWDCKEEANSIAKKIESIMKSGESGSEIAILVRAGFQTRLFEEKMINMNIPYQVIGTRFYEREEIRDAVAYLRLIHQDSDDLAFERVINKPARGIGKTTIQKLQMLARDTGQSLFETAQHIIKSDELGKKANSSLKEIVEKFEHWRRVEIAEDNMTLLKTVLEESGYIDFWKNSKDERSEGRIEALGSLISAVGEFENIGGFLEHVAIVMDTDNINDNGMVTIMTMHAAKGLEFNHVFLSGWEDGLFPSERSVEEGGVEGLEEEYRLAYVAITRAKRNCYISWVKSRFINGRFVRQIPSRFFSAIPTEYVEFTNNVKQSPRLNYGWKNNNDGVEIMQPKSSQNDNGWQNGMRCFHQKFGMGTIAMIDGDYITVGFDKAGVKKIMSTFLEKV